MAKRPTHAEQLAAIKRPDKLFRLIGENERLLVALRNLYDEQNGPPLILHRKTWQAAYDNAAALLKELEPESED